MTDPLRIGLGQEPDNLNAYLTWMASGVWLGSLILEPLVRPARDGTFTPVLAERVPTVDNGDVEPDGLRVTYRLRRDVAWSDGTPFTSHDVRATWEVLADPDHQVISREGFEFIAGVDCPDANTAVLRFSRPFPPFRVLFLCVYPAHRMRNLATPFTDDPFHLNPLGTGPYLLSDWQRGTLLRFAANPRYRGPRPHFDNLEFRCLPERAQLVELLLHGELDLGLALSAGDLPVLTAAGTLAPMVTTTASVERLVFNQRHAALGEVRVRRALELAIDKATIATDAFGRHAQVAASELDGTAWSVPGLAPSRYDPHEAARLLDVAGWLPGHDGVRAKDGIALRLVLKVTEGDPQRRAAATGIAAGLGRVGVPVTVDPVPAAEFFGNAANGGVLVRGDFDLALRARGMWGDPDPNMSICFQSRWVPGADNQGMGANFGGFSDPDVDNWLDEAQTTMDQDRRHDLYTRVQRRIADQVPVTYLYNLPNVDVARRGLAGLSPLPYLNVWGTVWNAHEWTEASNEEPAAVAHLR